MATGTRTRHGRYRVVDDVLVVAGAGLVLASAWTIAWQAATILLGLTLLAAGARR